MKISLLIICCAYSLSVFSQGDSLILNRIDSMVHSIDNGSKTMDTCIGILRNHNYLYQLYRCQIIKIINEHQHAGQIVTESFYFLDTSLIFYSKHKTPGYLSDYQDIPDEKYYFINQRFIQRTLESANNEKDLQEFTNDVFHKIIRAKGTIRRCIIGCEPFKARSAPSSLDELRLRADELLLSKADSSLLYYQKILQLDPLYQLAYIKNAIGNCYIKLKDTVNAEKNYLTNLTIDSAHKTGDPLGSQFNTCMSLVKIYYARKDYRKALIYLEYGKKYFNNYSRSKSQNNFENAYLKSVCYYKLGIKDSALTELAPFIYRTTGNGYPDDRIVKYFVNTAYEIYGKEKVKREIVKGLENISYSPIYFKDEEDCVFISVDCFIPFFNAKITLCKGPGVLVKKKGDIPSHYLKEKLIEDFKNSSIYFLITNY